MVPIYAEGGRSALDSANDIQSAVDRYRARRSSAVDTRPYDVVSM